MKKHQYYKTITIKITADRIDNLSRGFQQAIKIAEMYPAEIVVKDSLRDYKITIEGESNE